MEFSEIRERLEGVVAITVTPFTSNNTIDHNSLVTITKRMDDAGIPVITANGNTGEYYSLSFEERSQCIRAVKEGCQKAAILVGVGGAVENAINEALNAYKLGADAIMIHHPIHPYISEEGWVNYHHQIAEAIPDLGVITYVKGLNITANAIIELSKAAPNFIGIKYALPDPVRYASIRDDAKESNIVWIAGLAESYAASQFVGKATGFTSGLANVAPELSMNFFKLLKQGKFNDAYDMWTTFRAFEELRSKNNNAYNVSVVKEGLAQIGLCNRDVRPPISILTEDDQKLVRKLINTWSLN